MVEKVSGVKLRVEEGPRRAGDPAELVAGSSRVEQMLGWEPKQDDLDVICATAYKWEATLQGTPPDQRRQVGK
jgi:UDP-glucose 4-epimerase